MSSHGTIARSELLAGVKVLDFGRLMPSGIATFQLAALGADVVKVERPPDGDRLRTNAPLVSGRGDMHLGLNRSKRSIALDFTTESGMRAAQRMAAQVDVVVESSRPGTFRRYGLDYESLADLNPRLVYASFTGYGQSGPYSPLPAHGLCADAMGAILADAHEPHEVLPDSAMSIGAWAAGLYGAYAIAAALVSANPRGHYLDIAQADAAADVMFRDIIVANNAADGGQASFRELGPRYDVYDCADGLRVLLTATEAKLWDEFCGVVSRPDLCSAPGDPAVLPYGPDAQLRDQVSAIFATRSRAEWLALAQAHGLAIAPVHTPESYAADQHVQARHMVRDERHPMGGNVRLTGHPVSVDGAFAALDPAPELGEDTAEVLTDFGFTAEEAAELMEPVDESRCATSGGARL
jgi:crotonobetainyl-CoA:carnitine CoA-transferase CaiB-like acyl-CoA transferase